MAGEYSLGKRHGFTLIELILTLALISILLMVVTPRTSIYSSYYKNMELNTLRRDLNATRARAVSEGKTYTFHFVQGGYAYIIENYEDNSRRRVDLEYMRIISSNYKGFYFTSQGSITNPSTITIIGNDEEKYELSVGVATGKITIAKVND